LHLAFGYIDAVSNAPIRNYQKNLDLIARYLDVPDSPQSSSRLPDHDARIQLRVVRSQMFAVELSMRPVVRRCKIISFVVVALGIVVLSCGALRPHTIVGPWWSIAIVVVLVVPMPVMTVLCAVITKARSKDVGEAINGLSRQVF